MSYSGNIYNLPDKVKLDGGVPTRWLRITQNGRALKNVMLQFEIPPVVPYTAGRWRHLYDGRGKMITLDEQTASLLDGLANARFDAFYNPMNGCWTLRDSLGNKAYIPMLSDRSGSKQEIVILPAEQMHEPAPQLARSDLFVAGAQHLKQKAGPAATGIPPVLPSARAPATKLPLHGMQTTFKPLRDGLTEQVLHFMCPGKHISKKQAEWRALYDQKFDKITKDPFTNSSYRRWQEANSYIQWNPAHICWALHVPAIRFQKGVKGRQYPVPIPIAKVTKT